jgi:uncharacterized membrane protein
MAAYPWVHWLHLVAAAAWMGGLIAMAAIVLALRRAGAERPLLQAAARQFARVSWTAMVIAIATGVWQIELLHLPWTHQPLVLKLGLVGAAVILALLHTLTARRSSPGIRGLLQAAILIVSLAIFRAAVAI